MSEIIGIFFRIHAVNVELELDTLFIMNSSHFTLHSLNTENSQIEVTRCTIVALKERTNLRLWNM